MATKHYFSSFGTVVNGCNRDFSFSGRNRRPPRDPINALLSFLYTLGLKDLEHCLIGHGLDPAIGFLHQPSHKRPSLALDLLEAQRSAILDRFALRIISLRQIAVKDDFFISEGACLMNEKGLRTVVAAYSKFRLKKIAIFGRAVSPMRNTIELVKLFRENLLAVK